MCKRKRTARVQFLTKKNKKKWRHLNERKHFKNDIIAAWVLSFSLAHTHKAAGEQMACADQN